MGLSIGRRGLRQEIHSFQAAPFLAPVLESASEVLAHRENATDPATKRAGDNRDAVSMDGGSEAEVPVAEDEWIPQAASLKSRWDSRIVPPG